LFDRSSDRGPSRGYSPAPPTVVAINFAGTVALTTRWLSDEPTCGTTLFNERKHTPALHAREEKATQAAKHYMVWQPSVREQTGTV